MDARDFLQVAEDLIRFGPRPAHCRSAIGRAYYSAFNVAVSILSDLDLPKLAGPQAHTQVVRLLQQSKDSSLEIAGGMLGDLAEERRKADYHLNKPEVEKLSAANKALKTAKLIIIDIEAFDKDKMRKKEVSKVLKATSRP